MSKKVNIIVTQPPYGKEDAYSAIPLAETQAAAGSLPSITFVSGGVHSVVKGQKTGYGDPAIWQKDVPSVEATIIKAKESVRFYALEADLKKRGIADSEVIEGISKLNIDDLTDRILESEVTLVF
ncbi:DsrE family protein [Candidatus Methanoperedens nitratireducens]|uniref:Putative DsrE family protein n=1 Tax=Candidatus Methanoperedens nitratireducens TaxID=1392998 RepID=A0A284VP20_9EURY|nr:DsrE family protein [Candidatus Methanoperedens nitroreducens]SNQ60953.1 putative DsrE family protein [Candidatus Methanoperedens nitroreducens]